MTRIARQLVFFAAAVLTSAGAAAQPVETEIPGVTVELLELRVAAGALRLAVKLVNTTEAVTAPVGITFSDIVLVDSKKKTKASGLRGADGHFVAGPITDWAEGGRWWGKLPPKGEAVLWMYFAAVPPGTVLTVQIPKAFPFDDVPVSEGAGKVFSATTATSTPAGFTLSLVSARRVGDEMRVRMRIAPAPGAAARALEAEVLMADVFVFDSQGKRKFSLMKDSAGIFVAQPTTDKGQGGRLSLNMVTGTQLVALTFMAPAEDVSVVDIIVPRFLPLEGVKLAAGG